MTGVKSLQVTYWFRLRFQILGGIVFAGLFPYLIRLQVDGDASIGLINNTLIGIIIAIITGALLMRNVTTYPGSEALAYTLPSFCAAFGLLLFVFLFARIPYNRLLLSAGFAISLVWFFIMAIFVQRRRALRVGLLPFGDAIMLPDIRNISWRMLRFANDDVSDLDAIAADLRIALPDEWDRRLADYALQRVPVYHTKHLIEALTGKVELEHLSENNFGLLGPRRDYMTLKSVIDWLVALVTGVALLPILVIIGALIRLESKGPALFRQERIGYLGQPFIVYKFRTMNVGSGPMGDERQFAITLDKDDRITPLGRFLRKSRLDELPQLINVLKGEMSLIGPRPEASVLSRWYEQEIPFYRYRHVVRPGVAGWAQVCQGHVADVKEVREKLQYDFYYIKQYSVWIDLLIVVRTLHTMMTGYGAR